jgi:hypothetical protein
MVTTGKTTSPSLRLHAISPRRQECITDDAKFRTAYPIRGQVIGCTCGTPAFILNEDRQEGE